MGVELAKNINQTQGRQRQVILVYKTDYNILKKGKKQIYYFFSFIKFWNLGKDGMTPNAILSSTFISDTIGINSSFLVVFLNTVGKQLLGTRMILLTCI